MAAAGANVCDTPLDQDEYVETVAPKAPVTSQRFVPPHSLEAIPLPNVLQALEAVDADHPLGMPEYKSHGYSVLQQHVLFFDFDNDGIIYPWETFRGTQHGTQIPSRWIQSSCQFACVVVINGAFSYLTLDKRELFADGCFDRSVLSWSPSLLFPVYIKNIHKDKHGSDTEVYDTEGRFVLEKFEELFSKFSKSDKARLHFDEILALTNANMNAYDLFGWTAAKLE